MMHSQPPSNPTVVRGRSFEALQAVSKYVEAIREGLQAAVDGDEDAVRVPLERMKASIDLLSHRERTQAAQKACELLLETSPVSLLLVRCAGEIDQRFMVSSDRSEVIAALATRGLLQGISKLPADDLITLRRFAPPNLGNLPDLVNAVRARFVADIKEKNTQSAYKIYRYFSDVTALPQIKADIDFARASIALIRLMLDPWSEESRVREVPKISEALLPLHPSLGCEFLGSLAAAFERAVEAGSWSNARAAAACATPESQGKRPQTPEQTDANAYRKEDRQEGVFDEDLAQFYERIAAAARKPLDSLLCGTVNYNDVRSHLEAKSSVTELLQDIFSEDWKRLLGVAARTNDAVRQILNHQRSTPHTLQNGIDTVAALSVIYSLFSPAERESGQAPLFNRARVWVLHKLQELSTDLWCLSVMGQGEPPHPVLKGARVEEFARFARVLRQAQKIFHIEPARVDALGQPLAEWVARFEFHRQTDDRSSPDQTGTLGWLQRLRVRWKASQLEAQGWTALREDRAEEAASLSTSLLGTCARYPRVRHAMGPEVVASVCKLLASSCRSAMHGRGVFTSLLSQELRRERPDLTLVDSFARNAAQMYLHTGKPDTARRLLELAKRCSKKGATTEEVVRMAAGLKSRGLSRL